MKTCLTKHQRSLGWIGFFSLILASWLYLVSLSIQTAGIAPDLSDWVAGLNAICSVNPGSGGMASLLAMWLLMSIAMMAPTLVPSLRTYDDLIHAGAGTTTGFLALIGGYLTIWIAYSVGAAFLQFNMSVYFPPSQAPGTWRLLIDASLLLVAGIYQFSAAKASCLSQCRSPMMFYMQNWKPGTGGAFSMGIRQGLICVGCCWALMALAFVGGAMSLMWMGVATLLMTVEKLPDLGKPLTRPMGFIFLFAAAVFLGRAIATVQF